ncbi:MAG: hypothetical protein QGG36_14705 [Pirellulaceae bacterium]|nr:hypothetical protein [Pirellulaceae bacterium]MDP7017053.1 hypothetical protein [Pirellulaceae bacterium]
MRLPKKAEVEDIFFFDNELCVVYEQKGSYDTYFYWAHEPKKKTDMGWHYGRDGLSGAVLEIPDGGTFKGDGVVHRGDSKSSLSSPDQFFSDGKFCWLKQSEDGKEALREVDPKSGKKGRASLPAFFDEFAGGDVEIDFDDCLLLPAPRKTSPLGVADGLIGWRVRKNKDGAYEGNGIDGRKWSGGLDDNDSSVQGSLGLLDVPGSDDVLAISGGAGWSGYGYASQGLWAADGSYRVAAFDTSGGVYDAGQPTYLPPLFYHLLQPRDLASSKKLRKLTDKQAAALLAANAKDVEANDERDVDEDDVFEQTAAAVKKILPKLTNERLLCGIVAVVTEATRIADQLAELVESRDPKVEDDPTLIVSDEQERCVNDAMSALEIHCGYGEVEPIFPHLNAVCQFFSGERKDGPLPAASFEWYSLLNQLEPRVWKGMWRKEASETDALIEFLGHWGALPLQDLPGAFRYFSGSYTKNAPIPKRAKKKKSDDEDETLSLTQTINDNFYVIRGEKDWEDEWEWTVLEYSPNAKFKTPPNFKINEETPCTRGWTSAQLAQFREQFKQHRQPHPSDELLELLGEKTGLSRAETALVWMGFASFDYWDKNFLPKTFREAFKLKVAEADAARQSLKAINDKAQDRLVQRLMSEDFSLYWNDDNEKLGELWETAWAECVPQRLQIDADLVKVIDKILEWNWEPTRMLPAFASPKNHEAFKAADDWRMGADDDGDFDFDLTSKQEGSFDSAIVHTAGVLIPLLNHRLPVGDSGRRAMADAFDAAIACLNKPKMLLQLSSNYFYDNHKKVEDGKILKQLFSKVKQNTKRDKNWVADDGAVLGWSGEYQVMLAFRPAKFKKPADCERLLQMGQVVEGSNADEGGVDDGFKAFLLLRSDGFKAIRDRIKKTPLKAGQYESNPLYSAPDVVAAVAKKHKLSENAAMLYLQTLVLPDPTSANVKLWNEWATSDYSKACQELAAAKLVLEAKRSRAGRKHFLPGGWEDLKNPNLPLETWKTDLFGITRTKAGKLDLPLNFAFCPLPEYQLFELGWQRVLDGKAPRYEEVK